MGNGADAKSATTEFDLTDKEITPLGGFVNYGRVREDFLLVKGSVPGHVKRVVTLRATLHEQTFRDALEEIKLKFIDTSSKLGHGRFQSQKEKDAYMGPLKKNKAQ